MQDGEAEPEMTAKEKALRVDRLLQIARERPLDNDELWELADLQELDPEFCNTATSCKRLQASNKKNWNKLSLRPSLYLTKEEKLINKRGRLMKAKERCLKLASENPGFNEPYPQSRMPYGPVWIPRAQRPAPVYDPGMEPYNMDVLYPPIPDPPYLRPWQT